MTNINVVLLWYFLHYSKVYHSKTKKMACFVACNLHATFFIILIDYLLLNEIFVLNG